LQQVHVVIRPNENRVVVNQSVLHRSGKIDAAGAVVFADIVTGDGADVPRAGLGLLSAVVANQQKAAVVVVAIVVLNDGVLAVPIGIEPFSVALALGAIGFVILNQRVVSTPGPDGHVVAFGSLIGTPDDVVFHYRAVRRHHHNPVAADVVEDISPHGHTEARIPVRPLPPIGHAENTA